MPVRFVFVTDSHHYPDAPKDFAAPKMLTRSQVVLDALAPAINACSPDFVVHGGDLLCGGGSFELPEAVYLRSIDETATALDAIEAPVYVVPGNHDCDARTGSFAAFSSRFSIPYTVDVFDVGSGIRLATANVYQCDPITDGQGIWTIELDSHLREAARLASEDRCALILALHTWVVPLHGETGGSTLVTHSDRLLKTIAEHPAIVVAMTGHRNRICVSEGCLFLDTACVVGYPMGFREITLREDGSIGTTFIPLDLPELIQASYARSTPEANSAWNGGMDDRDMSYISPRLQALWPREEGVGS